VRLILEQMSPFGTSSDLLWRRRDPLITPPDVLSDGLVSHVVHKVKPGEHDALVLAALADISAPTM
jgi:hypothetical protein